MYTGTASGQGVSPARDTPPREIVQLKYRTASVPKGRQAQASIVSNMKIIRETMQAYG